jgi:class 3 adenylate cyclase
VADESDTERAVRAGLAVIDTAGSILLNNEPLQVRVGIATGLVVAGGVVGTAHEHEVVGETLNLAFRLQTSAEPGTLMSRRRSRVEPRSQASGARMGISRGLWRPNGQVEHRRDAGIDASRTTIVR